MTSLDPPMAAIAVPSEAEAEQAAQTGVDPAARDWFKDAIIYQMHVKAFHDASGDGVGDFAGLKQRLDYVQDLGVTAIWLLPFYASPLRDDGYDISDYRQIHTSYGDMVDFRAFLDEAHRRGIRVITELVVNHTSDQHPWFQRARQAPPDSPDRNFYVWSDTDQRYQSTRIIFLDTEKSNWTWDETANAYFWHRFYSHQPDLNFDNPRVFQEIVEVLRFWLDMGVDGLRLDAVPYLCEREGTNNENLPETHSVLKRIRQEVDARYPDRMLLAEANQWPEDTRPYFGDGDECHMAFHFPLMPRMYMALAQEDRHPIADILRQTPDIPENCQWALFLRNHDELTLEMVTDDERDYLWRIYATDSRARINLGIRRRLAPLLDNDRRKIELMNALLLSLPGTPVLYYGDELGMGDNYYLGDRDGVRTPMQWSADRNGGFSRADPQRLYLPPIMDAIYGYQSINVESQQRSPSSLLNWMRRMIAVRKAHAAFGRGALRLLYPRNRRVLAFVREQKDQRILCVFNMGRSAQAVELDLRDFRGAVPVELTGNSAFPPVGELPYMLTLPGYGFYWFVLAAEAQEPRWHVSTPEPVPDFVTLVATDTWQSALQGGSRQILEREVLSEFLMRQRWFAAKDAKIISIALKEFASLQGRSTKYPLAMCEVAIADGSTQHYFLPLSVAWGGDKVSAGSAALPFTLAKLRRGPRVGALLDAARDEDFVLDLAMAMSRKGGEQTDSLRFTAHPTLQPLSGHTTLRPIGAEQSNVSLIVGERVVLKLYRRVRPGVQPELEMTKFLTNVADFKNTPTLLGAVEQVAENGEPSALAIAFAFVENQGDTWNVVVEALDRALEDVSLLPENDGDQWHDALDRLYVFPLDLATKLGQRTAEMHRALATDTDDPAFKTEPLGRDQIRRWCEAIRSDAEKAFASMESASKDLGETAAQNVTQLLLGKRQVLLQHIEALTQVKAAGMVTRIHGDYHLGQVLLAKDDVVIIDFEGEPGRTLDERREKTSPLRDVAGMLRSLDYAASAALKRFAARAGGLPDRVVAVTTAWRERAGREFIDAYVETARGMPSFPEDRRDAAALLDLFLVQKTLYEISYEAANRPSWLTVPVRGMLDLLERAEAKPA
jgi:maltose alpha-D-glucosyltransferase / alpha-amylase